MGSGSGVCWSGTAFDVGGGGVGTCSGIAGAGVGAEGVRVESDVIIGGVDVGDIRMYSPTPLPTIAALISRMGRMRLELPLEFSGWLAGFFSAGVTGVSPNSQMV